MTRRWRLAALAYLAATVVAIIVLPWLSALVWGDLVPRLLAVLAR